MLFRKYNFYQLKHLELGFSTQGLESASPLSRKKSAKLSDDHWGDSER